MKLVVIGLGQCGGRLADEFARLNQRARQTRGIEILVDSFAINSDATDLAGIVSIKPDHHHRILIGAEITRGHGVAKMNELGADLRAASTMPFSSRIMRLDRSTRAPPCSKMSRNRSDSE